MTLMHRAMQLICTKEVSVHLRDCERVLIKPYRHDRLTDEVPISLPLAYCLPGSGQVYQGVNGTTPLDLDECPDSKRWMYVVE